MVGCVRHVSDHNLSKSLSTFTWRWQRSSVAGFCSRCSHASALELIGMVPVSIHQTLSLPFGDWPGVAPEILPPLRRIL